LAVRTISAKTVKLKALVQVSVKSLWSLPEMTVN